MYDEIEETGGFVVRDEITEDARRLFTRQNSGAYGGILDHKE